MTLTALTLVSLLSLGQHSFSEAWYLEMMEGKPQEALRKYQYIYKDPEAERLLRRRAALRAAECAEKLGDREKALEIYGWFESDRGADDAITRKALARLRTLSSSSTPDSGSQRFARPLVERLEEMVRRRGEALEIVVKEKERQRQLNETIDGVESRLRTVGVELSWPDRWDPPAEPLVFGSEEGLANAFLKSLQLHPDDETLLRRQLAHRLYVRGLKALRASELRAALIAFQLQQEISGDKQGEVTELRQMLQNILHYANQLSKVAEKRLAEEYDGRRSSALAGFEKVFAEARRQSREGLDGEAVESYVEVRRRRDWAPVGILREGRVPTSSVLSLAPSADLLPPRSYRRIEELEKESSELAGELAFALEDVLTTWPRPGQTPAPKLEERDVMLPRLKRALEEDIETIESGEKDSEARLNETLQVLQWFTELDPAERYQGMIKSKLPRRR